MIDAATLSARLAECKRLGVSWDDAWRQSAGSVPPGPRADRNEDTSYERFTYLSMRAHYLGEDSTVVALSSDLAADPDASAAARGASRP